MTMKKSSPNSNFTISNENQQMFSAGSTGLAAGNGLICGRSSILVIFHGEFTPTKSVHVSIVLIHQ
jgi:hypothetical protein